MNTHEAVVWVCSLFCCSRDDYQLLHRGLLDIFMYNDQFAVGILPVLQVKRQKKQEKSGTIIRSHRFFLCTLY